jgi:ubiquinone biosynthesis protein UbiJ
MLTSAIVPPINHVLRQADWARAKLREHQGKVARITVVPFTFAFVIAEGGEVNAAAPGALPSVEISLTPPVLLRLFAGSDSAISEADISGDAGFAADIHAIARDLRYDAEEDLSRVLGDIAAHRVASTGRDFVAWQMSLFSDFAARSADFLTFERPVLISAPRVHEFVREVDELVDAVARLEKRIEKLEARG